MRIAKSGRVALLTALLCPNWAQTTPVVTAPAYHHDFNGPETSWRLLDTGVQARILAQECVPSGARDSGGSERVVAAAAAGESALLMCPVAGASVIQELEVRLWVKSSRPDIRLAARIVLPRTRGSQDDSLSTVIVKGPMYDRPGRWQQLILEDIPKLLAAEVRVMRSTAGGKVDPREAFIDAVVLVVPGEPNGIEVVTDELEVEGVLRDGVDDVQLASYPAPAAAVTVSNVGTQQAAVTLRRLPGPTHAPAALSENSSVRLRGTTLFVDGKPFTPRGVEWQGEPLQFLASRGFNVVQMESPPTAEQIDEAHRNALWFMCSPPRPDAIPRDGLGRPGDRIIAWYLRDEAIETDVSYATRWAELIREHDSVPGRPIVIAPEIDWPAASKSADILLARHPRFGRAAEQDYDKWLVDRSPLARPGTPLWASCSAQFDEAVGRQVSALVDTELPAPSIDSRQIESLVRIGSARGIRGFIFQSQSALNQTDVVTRRRAATLELINRRLQLIEPWLAAGKIITRVSSLDGAWIGVVLHVDRARLLIPIAEHPSVPARDGARTATTRAAGTVFVVPGVPESSQVFAISPAAMHTLPAQRITGGTRIALRPDDNAVVLMTEDPQVVQSLRQRITRDGAQFVRIERDVTLLQAASIAEYARRMTQLGRPSQDATQAVAMASGQLRETEAMLASGRIEQAYRIIAPSKKTLERAAEELRTLDDATSYQSNPLALSSDQVVECAAFERSLDQLQGGDNVLYGGDFEDLGQMTQSGWRHFRDSNSGVESRAELSTIDPRHGSYCLELHAAVTAEVSNLSTGDSAAVWIQSPPVPVPGGQIVEITGWARIDQPISGSGDGLQLADSLGGPDLMLTIRQTNGWQPFRLIRAAPESAELRLTFALTGLGTARIDGVMIRPLEQSSSQLPTLAPAAAASPAPVSTNAGPLFVVPQTR